MEKIDLNHSSGENAVGLQWTLEHLTPATPVVPYPPKGGKGTTLKHWSS
jgi:hypothetical protein